MRRPAGAPPLIHIAIEHDGIRAAARDALFGAGYAVTETAGARAMVDQLQRSWPDLLLIGTMFTDGDGFKLVEQVRALPQGPGLSIIAVALCLCPACQRLLVSSDFTDFIATPLDQERLLAVVRTYLPRHDGSGRQQR